MFYEENLSPPLRSPPERRNCRMILCFGGRAFRLVSCLVLNTLLALLYGLGGGAIAEIGREVLRDARPGGGAVPGCRNRSC
jgi:hypothetical protein